MTRLEHDNAKNALTRTVNFSDYKVINGVEIAHTLTVEDVIKTRKTIAHMKSVEINQELSTEMFTLSNLENP